MEYMDAGTRAFEVRAPTPAAMYPRTKVLRAVTLIADFTSRYAVVQVSDRLVSLNRHPPDEWDPRSNKTVIFLASDAIVSISYSD
jgi:hypothetical protein